MEDYCAKSHNTVPESNGSVEDFVINSTKSSHSKMLSKMGMADN
jgi:hypothetical protein